MKPILLVALSSMTLLIPLPHNKAGKGDTIVHIPTKQLMFNTLSEPLQAPVAALEAVADETPTPEPTVAPAAPTLDCGSDPNLAYIYQHESGCCTTKWQGEHVCDVYHGVPGDYSGLGYGLCQSTPPSKMANAGSDWTTNWSTQNSWCYNYAIDRYGSTYNAYVWWTVHHNW